MNSSTHHEWTQKKTSQILAEISEISSEETISLDQMLMYMRGRAFGLVIVLFALLSLIPNLFGHTILTGALLILLGLQMALGFVRIRLPEKVRQKTIQERKVAAVISKTVPYIVFIEKFLKPRLIFLTEDLGRRLIGVLILPLAILIMIPLPLTNFWPALTILILALGLIEKDGIAVLIGFVMSAFAFIIMKEVVELIFLKIQLLG